MLAAHSTGGLVTSLWADMRQPAALRGLVLNSPWFDLQGKAWMRSLGRVGRARPARPPPAPRARSCAAVEGFYTRSLHRDHEGEWDFDLALKPVDSFAVRAGWLRAIRKGHARLHGGLDLPCPALVLSSDRTTWPREMGEDVFSHDIVLDVEQIRRWAPALGRHVTYVAVPGARPRRRAVAAAGPRPGVRRARELVVGLRRGAGRRLSGRPRGGGIRRPSRGAASA